MADTGYNTTNYQRQGSGLSVEPNMAEYVTLTSSVVGTSGSVMLVTIAAICGGSQAITDNIALQGILVTSVTTAGRYTEATSVASITADVGGVITSNAKATTFVVVMDPTGAATIRITAAGSAVATAVGIIDHKGRITYTGPLTISV